MTVLELTPKSGPKRGRATNGNERSQGREMKQGTTRALVAMLSVIGATGPSGCINVAAPEEPIVIELNINITAEVLYRLADDAGNTIDENADIF